MENQISFSGRIEFRLIRVSKGQYGSVIKIQHIWTKRKKLKLTFDRQPRWDLSDLPFLDLKQIYNIETLRVSFVVWRHSEKMERHLLKQWTSCRLSKDSTQLKFPSSSPGFSDSGSQREKREKREKRKFSLVYVSHFARKWTQKRKTRVFC